MAQGFACLGHDVTVICLQTLGGQATPEQLTKAYGLSAPLHWVQLPRQLLGQPVDHHWRFALLALPAIFRLQPDLVFVRSYILPALTSQFGVTTVVESHAYINDNSVQFQRLLKVTKRPDFKLLVTISEELARHYQERGVPASKLKVLPTGVDLAQFQRPAMLPPSPYAPYARPSVTYVGHLYDYKGIPTILAAAALLPTVTFHLIGGLPNDLARQQQRVQDLKLGNVLFHGLKPYVEVAPFLWHAQALLLPPSAHHPSAVWTSPVKLGEYLASGTPVVATSIPALQAWVTEEEVCFVTPDDAVAMVAGITNVLDKPDYAMTLVQKGLAKAQSFSYTHRAKSIINRLELS